MFQFPNKNNNKNIANNSNPIKSYFNILNFKFQEKFSLNIIFHCIKCIRSLFENLKYLEVVSMDYKQYWFLG